MSWWVHEQYASGGAGAVAAWIFWVITSIVLHELGHGIAAIKNGDNTPRELGHMTLNPMVHMGPVSLLMFAILGIAWGAMPVNPSRFHRYRWGCFTVAAAGPAVNAVLSVLCIAAAGVWLWACIGDHLQVSDQLRVNVFEFFFTGAFLNIVLCGFNLIPVPPLDGSRIVAAAVPATQRFLAQPGVAMYGLFVALFLFGSVIMQPLERTAVTWSMKGASKVAHQLPPVKEENVRGDTLDLVWMLGDPKLPELMREFRATKEQEESGQETPPMPPVGQTDSEGTESDPNATPPDPRTNPRRFFDLRPAPGNAPPASAPPAATPPAATPPRIQ